MDDGLANLNRLNGGRFTSLLFQFLWYLLLIIAIAACSTPERRVIKNPEMNSWNAEQRRYVNLFQPQYGKLEETEFDAIDFLKNRVY